MGYETTNVNVGGSEKLAEWVRQQTELATLQKALRDLPREQLRRGAFVAVPTGVEVREIVAAEAPCDFEGTVVLDDVQSFLDYCKRYANDTESSIYLRLVFGDAVPLRALCVIDDHGNGGNHAGLRAWRALLDIRLQDQAAAVLKSCIGVKRPLELAEIIEDNEDFIVEPAAAKLLEVALTLKAAQNARLVEAHNLNNGDMHIEYVTETTASAGREQGSLNIPETVTLRLALFDGQPARELVLRFRYRVHDGKLVFELSCPGFKHVVKAAADELAAELRAGAPCPVYLGALRD